MVEIEANQCDYQPIMNHQQCIYADHGKNFEHLQLSSKFHNKSLLSVWFNVKQLVSKMDKHFLKNNLCISLKN